MGVGNKTGPIDYLRHPVPLHGEIWQTGFLFFEGRPLWWAKAQCVLGPIPEHPVHVSIAVQCRALHQQLDDQNLGSIRK